MQSCNSRASVAESGIHVVLSLCVFCFFQVTVSGQLVFGTLLHRTVQLKLVTTGSLHEPVVDIGDQRSSLSYVTDSSVVKAVKIRWKGEEAWSSDISISSSRVGVGHLTKVHVTYCCCYSFSVQICNLACEK